MFKKNKSVCATKASNKEQVDLSIYLPIRKPSSCDLSFYDRLYLSLKGCALGDYAGQPYEAVSLFECKDLKIEDLYKKSRDITDDTILTCATIDVLTTTKEYVKGNPYGIAYQSYAKKYTNPLGGYGARFLAWVYTGVAPNSCGNGSAMRVGPCGCLEYLDDVIDESYKSALCTHSHPEGIKGAIVTAVCIWMAFHGYEKKDIGEYVGAMYSDSPYSPNVKWDIMKHYANVQGNPAVCQTTVPMAVSCFVNSDSYEDCILKAIQFGWDTDTQAAIAGSIAAAYYRNFSDISNEIWESLKKNKYIKEIVDI